ncbi:c-type cytochrome [Lentisalinibacter orientalis]|uniref:c-type cytochrome n=1 Tax=Lentisalinibacter orientalis TaxID=2992241 RepID=UPI0038651DC6
MMPETLLPTFLRNFLRPACLATLLLLGTGAAAESLIDGSAEAGKSKSTTCAACHGADGVSVNPEWPNLAGQNARYVYEQLLAFQNGDRQNVLMSSQAMGLSDQDMKDLGVYFEAQDLPPRAIANPDLVTMGERLYRGGDQEAGISACIACHGPRGFGNPAAAYPKLRGQHATYTASTLKAYRSGERKSGMNKVMNNIAERLNDEQIEALASYVQGLK